MTLLRRRGVAGVWCCGGRKGSSLKTAMIPSSLSLMETTRRTRGARRARWWGRRFLGELLVTAACSSRGEQLRQARVEGGAGILCMGRMRKGSGGRASARGTLWRARRGSGLSHRAGNNGNGRRELRIPASNSKSMRARLKESKEGKRRRGSEL